MDAGVLALLIPVLALATGFVAVLRMPKSAFESKPKKPRVDEGKIEELEEQLTELRRELAEVQERLDFTERALVQSRTSAPIAPPPAQDTPPFITPTA